MLYLIGLGLNEKGYSREAYDVISKADKIYVDTYTIEFPYEISELVSQFKGKKFMAVGRDFVLCCNRFRAGTPRIMVGTSSP